MVRPGSRGDSCLDEDHGVKGSRSCPDSEVRKPWRHTLMRTSESKGHEQLYGSGAPFEPEVRNRTRGTPVRTSGSGHQPAAKPPLTPWSASKILSPMRSR